jgi:probable rRNA maturation factor
VDFFNEYPRVIPYQKALITLCCTILQQEYQAGVLAAPGPVNVVFTDDSFVRNLNATYRKKDKTTDVLSFIYEEPDMWGEVYISVPQVMRQAPRFANTYYRELKKMLIHGILHIAGYDHIKPNDRKIMRQKEEAYWNLFSKP